MAWLEFFYCMEMLESRNIWIIAPFFSLLPYAEWEKNTIWIFQFLILPMTGIEPGPPVQQASALSITPLPLGHKTKCYIAPFYCGWGRMKKYFVSYWMSLNCLTSKSWSCWYFELNGSIIFTDKPSLQMYAALDVNSGRCFFSRERSFWT